MKPWTLSDVGFALDPGTSMYDRGRALANEADAHVEMPPCLPTNSPTSAPACGVRAQTLPSFAVCSLDTSVKYDPGPSLPVTPPDATGPDTETSAGEWFDRHYNSIDAMPTQVHSR